MLPRVMFTVIQIVSSARSGKRSAGIVVVRRMAGEWRCLMLRACRKWDFPKGEIELGETPLGAALRETLEETRLAHVVLRWGEQFSYMALTQDKVARYCLGDAAETMVCLPVNPLLER
jgi:bis(5'-nucleosidyl)-tetraphosphatase